jgi:hypothetical protein
MIYEDPLDNRLNYIEYGIFLTWHSNSTKYYYTYTTHKVHYMPEPFASCEYNAREF